MKMPASFSTSAYLHVIQALLGALLGLLRDVRVLQGTAYMSIPDALSTT